MSRKCTRKNSPLVKVYCLPDERVQLQANARAARKPLFTYLLKVGLGYHVPNVADRCRANAPLSISANLGRLGRALIATSFSGYSGCGQP